MAAARKRFRLVCRIPSGDVGAPVLDAWRANASAGAPWNGTLGFPITDLLPTGSATWHQEFEAGTILWEPRDCTAGAYTARVVSGLRGPITRSNLTMLCESDPPENKAYAPVSAPVPFDLPEGRGTYTYHGGRDASGWYEGITLTLEGGAPIEVSGPVFSAWIATGAREGNAATPLVTSAMSGAWGLPTGNAGSQVTPTFLVKQNFANGVVTVKTGGIVGWAPSDIILPVGFRPIERGYTNPPPPADPRDPIGHRSGDFITLAWLNKATAPGITTHLYRSATPLNGSPGPWTLIHTYPSTLPANSQTLFTDHGPTNNARNCYALRLSEGGSSEWTNTACTFTLDGTTDSNGIDHSLPRGVSRAQVRIGVPGSPADAATRKPVAVTLVSLGGPGKFSHTVLDSTHLDFALGSSRAYDLRLEGIGDVADIDGLRLELWGYNDNLRVDSLELILDNVTVFSKTFDPPVELHSTSYPNPSQQDLEIGFDELRSDPLWNDIYATGPNSFLGFDRSAFKEKLDSVLGHLVLMTPGAAYNGSRLRDGHHTGLSKPSGFQRDRLHVRQHVVAQAEHGIRCTLDYNLRLAARDIHGTPVSPFVNGPRRRRPGQHLHDGDPAREPARGLRQRLLERHALHAALVRDLRLRHRRPGSRHRAEPERASAQPSPVLAADQHALLLPRHGRGARGPGVPERRARRVSRLISARSRR